MATETWQEKPTPGQARYSEKLKSWKWQERAYEVKKAAGGKCRECGSDHDLTVHHCHYIRGREPWDYPLTLLMCLCRTCHFERQTIEEQLMLDIAIHLSERDLEGIKQSEAWMYLHDHTFEGHFEKY